MINKQEAIVLAFTKDPQYEVFTFCKENGIDCSHDFNSNAGVSWTDIYMNGSPLMQVDSSMTKDHFVELIKRLSDKNEFDNFKKTKIIEDDGPDFWIALKGWNLFEKFIFKYHSAIFT